LSIACDEKNSLSFQTLAIAMVLIHASGLRGPTPWPDINKIQEMIFDGRLDVLAAELIICGLKAVDEMNLVMSRLVFSTRNVGPESLNLRIIFAAWALNGFYLSTCCQKMKVSGVGCQGKEMLDTETSYETS
jgi:hypothetical protein